MNEYTDIYLLKDTLFIELKIVELVGNSRGFWGYAL